jgi:hypothetical protein
MSDGCSALSIGPRALRRRFNLWLFSRWPDATEGCLAHDRSYYYGGSMATRLQADEDLMDAWADAGVPEQTRQLAWTLIRFGGAPTWRTPGVSWAFGGGVFEYTGPRRLPQ